MKIVNLYMIIKEKNANSFKLGSLNLQLSILNVKSSFFIYKYMKKENKISSLHFLECSPLHCVVKINKFREQFPYKNLNTSFYRKQKMPHAKQHNSLT